MIVNITKRTYIIINATKSHTSHCQPDLFRHTVAQWQYGNRMHTDRQRHIYNATPTNDRSVFCVILLVCFLIFTPAIFTTTTAVYSHMPSKWQNGT